MGVATHKLGKLGLTVLEASLNGWVATPIGVKTHQLGKPWFPVKSNESQGKENADIDRKHSDGFGRWRAPSSRTCGVWRSTPATQRRRRRRRRRRPAAPSPPSSSASSSASPSAQVRPFFQPFQSFQTRSFLERAEPDADVASPIQHPPGIGFRLAGGRPGTVWIKSRGKIRAKGFVQ